ncbi:MAG TPA: hemerythrin domain-containing protein [Trebonia sp.]
MTELASHRARPEHQARAVPVPGTGAADVIELVLADHRRILRLSQALDNGARWTARSGFGWVPAHVWPRLAELIQAHTLAEEEICHLPAFLLGSQAAAHVHDMAADHDDIREAIAEAALQPAGSPRWWRAVRAVQATLPFHLDQEERGILASLRQQLPASRRLELGRQWTAFTAAWTLDASR